MSPKGDLRIYIYSEEIIEIQLNNKIADMKVENEIYKFYDRKTGIPTCAALYI